MKKLSGLCFILFLSISTTLKAQDDTWPKVINTNDGSVLKIYEPQPESFSGNTLKMRQAVSLLQSGKTDPVFGTYWAVATVQTDRDNRRIDIESVKVPNVKFSDNVDDNTVSYVKTTLETEIPNAEPDLSQDDILASLESDNQAKSLSKDLENNPPKIIYSSRPSILVVIDGTPKLQRNDSWGLDAVVNTPFTIVKNNDGRFYLYGGKHWYKAPSATGPYTFVNNAPQNLYQIQTAVDNANASDPGYSSDSANAEPDVISDIIVSTTPAELIQTNGQPSLTSIDGTGLSYISNSQNDIFQSESDQQYYVLISGRWYKSSNLTGPWQYTASNNLPADFAKIPEGSPKDNVLASVAGTDAARDAVMDAQIPQTAKVDRNTATANVSYDGNPQFNNIEGTSMQYATNTQSSVIFDRGVYYSVDNGVWFQSNSPSGPWAVCIDRPDDVDLIPPSYPVYNMKYVYIYDVDPNWVYMGYTPGYLNTFIYGSTVVYGTGYYYRPWYGNYYYPRPCTWGYNVHYSPWAGWSLGYTYRYNWFHIGFGVSAWSGWRGGWWGPSVYRPAYRSNPYRTRGYYGRDAFAGRPVIRNTNVIRANNFRNNIYNTRRDVVTVNNNRGYRPNNNRPNGIGGRPAPSNNQGNNYNRGQMQPERPQQQPGNPGIRPQQPTQRPQPNNNNITTDRTGNVYQRSTEANNNGQWQQRSQNQWKPVDNSAKPEVIQNLNRQQQMQVRGQQRTQNFQSSRQPQPTQPMRSSGGGNGGGNRNSGGNNGGGNRGGGNDGGSRRH